MGQGAILNNTVANCQKELHEIVKNAKKNITDLVEDVRSAERNMVNIKSAIDERQSLNSETEKNITYFHTQMIEYQKQNHAFSEMRDQAQGILSQLTDTLENVKAEFISFNTKKLEFENTKETLHELYHDVEGRITQCSNQFNEFIQKTHVGFEHVLSDMEAKKESVINNFNAELRNNFALESKQLNTELHVALEQAYRKYTVKIRALEAGLERHEHVFEEKVSAVNEVVDREVKRLQVYKESAEKDINQSISNRSSFIQHSLEQRKNELEKQYSQFHTQQSATTLDLQKKIKSLARTLDDIFQGSRKQSEDLKEHFTQFTQFHKKEVHTMEKNMDTKQDQLAMIEEKMLLLDKNIKRNFEAESSKREKIVEELWKEERIHLHEKLKNQRGVLTQAFARSEKEAEDHVITLKQKAEKVQKQQLQEYEKQLTTLLSSNEIQETLESGKVKVHNTLTQLDRQTNDMYARSVEEIAKYTQSLISRKEENEAELQSLQAKYIKEQNQLCRESAARIMEIEKEHREELEERKKMLQGYIDEQEQEKELIIQGYESSIKDLGNSVEKNMEEQKRILADMSAEHDNAYTDLARETSKYMQELKEKQEKYTQELHQDIDALRLENDATFQFVHNTSHFLTQDIQSQMNEVKREQQVKLQHFQEEIQKDIEIHKESSSVIEKRYSTAVEKHENNLTAIEQSTVEISYAYAKKQSELEKEYRQFVDAHASAMRSLELSLSEEKNSFLTRIEDMKKSLLQKQNVEIEAVRTQFEQICNKELRQLEQKCRDRLRILELKEEDLAKSAQQHTEANKKELAHFVQSFEKDGAEMNANLNILRAKHAEVLCQLEEDKGLLQSLAQLSDKLSEKYLHVKNDLQELETKHKESQSYSKKFDSLKKENKLEEKHQSYENVISNVDEVFQQMHKIDSQTSELNSTHKRLSKEIEDIKSHYGSIKEIHSYIYEIKEIEPSITQQLESVKKHREAFIHLEQKLLDLDEKISKKIGLLSSIQTSDDTKRGRSIMSPTKRYASLSNEEKTELIIELHKQHYTKDQIAKTIGVTVDLIDYVLDKTTLH
ncbi:myosin-13-like [Ylistrum balloti]|uniref:myosin-13-like n=1 Tax=Ylistrum balloti TaxID=509963 RepID=UPI002905CB5E|nr:myosin-13-like [Ylistrum balloti]